MLPMTLLDCLLPPQQLADIVFYLLFMCFSLCSKILELEEELKVVGNNMKSLEISESEVVGKLV